MNRLEAQDVHRHLNELVQIALRAADPVPALRRAWVAPSGPTHLLAVGKAAFPMLRQAQALCGQWLGRCLAVGPPVDNPGLSGGECVFADHPYPTPRNLDAAQKVSGFVESLRPPDRLVVLLSGGGSAFLTMPSPGLTLPDLVEVNRALQLAGASIRELNTVRRHTEELKGGRLAGLCRVATEVYVLSDVLGDPLEVIASGPFAPDPTTYADALEVLRRYALGTACPAVVAHLEAGARGERPETLKPGDPAFARVTHRVIASNALVTAALHRQVTEWGYHAPRSITGYEGEAAALGRSLARWATEARASGAAPAAIVVGGEPVVRVGDAGGIGGPSQEAALAFACETEPGTRAACLMLSTDGRDGPTDAAGAIVDGGTAGLAWNAGVDPGRALAEHDSHRALAAAGALLRTGVTGTNLNHLGVVLVW